MAKTITIIDGNNWLRRLYQKELDTSALRTATLEIRTLLSTPDNRVIYVWDGLSCNRYRREIFPDYKGNRGDLPDGFLEQLKAFKRILSNLPIITVEVPYYEADDVIATLVKGFQTSEHFKDIEVIHIKSTDKDFHQLGVSYEGKRLEVAPKHTVLYKILIGDTSDKIPGVPGFGIKKFEKLDLDAASQWMEADFAPAHVPDMPETQKKWCEENVATLKAMRDVCLFRPVPDGLLDEHAGFGDNKPEEVDKILKEHMA